MKTNTPAVNAAQAAGAEIEALTDRAGAALQRARRATEHTLDTLQAGVEGVRDGAPSALSRAATHGDELAQRGLEAARALAAQARQRAGEAGERAREVVRDEPIKSVLAAAAAGAAAALLVSWAVRGQRREGR